MPSNTQHSCIEKVRKAPVGPGCYLFKNRLGYVIYVGKGKNIRKRVGQYFQPSRHGRAHDKVGKMVGMITDVEFVETATELDALLEEYRLIKMYSPWFNSQLKSHKLHPYIRIGKTGCYATLSIVNEKQADDAEYFGSFFDKEDAQAALDTLGRVWKTPTCGKTSFSSRKACLRYHLGECLAPCEDKPAPERYAQVIDEVQRFLHGEDRSVYDHLEEQIAAHAASLEFEAATACKLRIAELERLQRKSARSFHFPQDTDLILLIRVYHSHDTAAFYLRKGLAVGRADFSGSFDDAKIQDLLRQAEAGTSFSKDGWLEKGLAEIHADKLFIPLAPKIVGKDIIGHVKNRSAAFFDEPA